MQQLEFAFNKLCLNVEAYIAMRADRKEAAELDAAIVTVKNAIIELRKLQSENQKSLQSKVPESVREG